MEYERLVRLFFLAAFVAVSYELYLILKPFLAPIAWALILGFIFHPLAEWVQLVIRYRSLAALLIVLLVAFLVIGPSFWLATLLVREAQTLYAQATGLIGHPGASTLLDHFFAWGPTASVDSFLARHGLDLKQELSSLAVQGARRISSWVVHNLSSVARNVASLTLDFAIMLTTFFFVLRDGSQYYRTLFEITPLYEQDKRAVFDALTRTLAAVVRGVMLTALLQGALLGIAFYYLDVPFWASFSLAAAACGLLPVGGTALVWVPLTIYLFYASGVWHAAALAIWSVAFVIPVEHVAKPVFIGYESGLTVLALFFGILGGLKEFGVLGLFVGPVVISIFVALVEAYRRSYGQPRKQAPAPV